MNIINIISIAIALAVGFSMSMIKVEIIIPAIIKSKIEFTSKSICTNFGRIPINTDWSQYFVQTWSACFFAVKFFLF